MKLSLTVSESFSSIASGYDAFLLDLWGVVHDGSQLYGGVKDCIQRLRAQDKKIIFLSNAPRRAWRAAEVLTALGIEKELYDFVMTSGEIAFQALAQLPAKKYYYVGPEKDAGLADGTAHVRVNNIEDAELLLLVDYEYRDQPDSAFDALIHKAQGGGVDVWCINPDIEVVKITGERILCAGAIAKYYESMGGRVRYFGKPYPDVYEAIERALNLGPARMLAVGDTIETDIVGAVRVGIDGALVTGGVLKNKLHISEHSPAVMQKISGMCEDANARPKYILPALVW